MSRQTSSHVVFQRSPLRRLQHHASCPDSTLDECLVLGVTLPNATHLPPLLFFPTPAVYSACCLVGLLHPTASRGVRVVSSPVSHPPCKHDVWSPVPFPHSHLTPSEVFPFAAAVLCHHIRCLPAVSSAYCFQSTDSRPQGLAPLRNPLSSAGIATCL